MSDPTDGDRDGGPSDEPSRDGDDATADATSGDLSTEDPFEYPADAEDTGDVDADATDGPGTTTTAPGDEDAHDEDAHDDGDFTGVHVADDPGTGHTRGGTAASADRPSGVVGWLRWFWTTDTGAVVYVRDVVTSVAAVLIIGLVLFAISGIWPPMVAVESGSMEPNMHEGDLVFVMDNERLTPEEAPEYQGTSTGVVPADVAADVGHTDFGRHGDVIVFMPDGEGWRTPIIHRAILWVEAGEDWYDRADPAHVGNADSCEALSHCPAPHAGFITLGDANPTYDQERGLSAPVRPGWVIGTAELRVPYLGHIRLAFSGHTAPHYGSLAGAAPVDAPPAPRAVNGSAAGGGGASAAA